MGDARSHSGRDGRESASLAATLGRMLTILPFLHYKDPLLAEILKFIPDASAHNIEYSTHMWEQVLTNAAAGLACTTHINRRSKQCPNQRYVVAGYSKGTIGLHQW